MPFRAPLILSDRPQGGSARPSHRYDRAVSREVLVALTAPRLRSSDDALLGRAVVRSVKQQRYLRPARLLMMTEDV